MPQTFSSTQRAVDIGRAVPRHATQLKRILPAVRRAAGVPRSSAVVVAAFLDQMSLEQRQRANHVEFDQFEFESDGR